MRKKQTLRILRMFIQGLWNDETGRVSGLFHFIRVRNIIYVRTYNHEDYLKSVGEL